MYINYKRDGITETIEDLRGLTRREKMTLIREYRLVDVNYYLSSRATKQFYESIKDKTKC